MLDSGLTRVFLPPHSPLLGLLAVAAWTWFRSGVHASLGTGCSSSLSFSTLSFTVLHKIYIRIGLNPGPRARTVKPGPRHLRTRPDPGQNRLGPHKGIPSGEARQCTPAGTEAVISALAPTAPPPIKAAQNATTVDTRSKTVALCTRRVHLLTPTSQRDQISQGHKFAGARTHRQTGTNSMQYANASWGDTPANAHLSRVTPKSQGSLLAPAQTL